MISGDVNYQHECWRVFHSIPGKFHHFHPVFFIFPHFWSRNSWHPRKPKHLENRNQSVWSRVSESDDPKAPVFYIFSSSAASRKTGRLGLLPFLFDFRSFLLAWRTFIVIFRLSTFAPIFTMWLSPTKISSESVGIIIFPRWPTRVRNPQGQQLTKTLCRKNFKWSHFSFLHWHFVRRWTVFPVWRRSVYKPSFRFSFFYLIIENRKVVTKHPFPFSQSTNKKNEK